MGPLPATPEAEAIVTAEALVLAAAGGALAAATQAEQTLGTTSTIPSMMAAAATAAGLVRAATDSALTEASDDHCTIEVAPSETLDMSLKKVANPEDAMETPEKTATLAVGQVTVVGNPAVAPPKLDMIAKAVSAVPAMREQPRVLNLRQVSASAPVTPATSTTTSFEAIEMTGLKRQGSAPPKPTSEELDAEVTLLQLLRKLPKAPLPPPPSAPSARAVGCEAASTTLLKKKSSVIRTAAPKAPAPLPTRRTTPSSSVCSSSAPSSNCSVLPMIARAQTPAKAQPAQPEMDKDSLDGDSASSAGSEIPGKPPRSPAVGEKLPCTGQVPAGPKHVSASTKGDGTSDRIRENVTAVAKTTATLANEACSAKPKPLAAVGANGLSVPGDTKPSAESLRCSLPREGPCVAGTGHGSVATGPAGAFPAADQQCPLGQASASAGPPLAQTPEAQQVADILTSSSRAWTSRLSMPTEASLVKSMEATLDAAPSFHSARSASGVHAPPGIEKLQRTGSTTGKTTPPVLEAPKEESAVQGASTSKQDLPPEPPPLPPPSDPAPRRRLNVTKEQYDGCIRWTVALSKTSPGDKYGLVQSNGKLDFEARANDAGLCFESASAKGGPDVLLVRQIHQGGLLDAWNNKHPDAAVQPMDRICMVNGKKRVGEMQCELRSCQVSMRIMRFPERFMVELKKEGGQRMGFRFDRPPPEAPLQELRITEVSRGGALADHNARMVSEGRWHLVVFSEMRVEAANGQSGDALKASEELKRCQTANLRIRRA